MLALILEVGDTDPSAWQRLADVQTARREVGNPPLQVKSVLQSHLLADRTEMVDNVEQWWTLVSLLNIYIS